MPVSPLRRRLERWYQLAPQEAGRLDALLDASRERYTRGEDVVALGERNRLFLCVLSGWAMRYRVTGSGRRQIVHFLLPGDTINPDVLLGIEADHGVQAITELHLQRVSAEELAALFREAPGVLAALWWSNVQEQGILREHIVRVGRRNAYERTGHLLLELHRRLSLVDVDGHAMDFPLTQAHLADALGLTTVHVNRTLRRLRENGLVQLSRAGVRLVDVERLAGICDFDARHLHLDNSVENAIFVTRAAK